VQKEEEEAKLEGGFTHPRKKTKNHRRHREHTSRKPRKAIPEYEGDQTDRTVKIWVGKTSAKEAKNRSGASEFWGKKEKGEKKSRVDGGGGDEGREDHDEKKRGRAYANEDMSPHSSSKKGRRGKKLGRESKDSELRGGEQVLSSRHEFQLLSTSYRVLVKEGCRGLEKGGK